ncbi:glycosyl transferase [Nostoc sp. CENA543]|uniref:glycosyltransferase family 2 protein n=1 Tax=Nostoc sp. CENA543 TaxID=1869241 RepID=UPI000CA27403|nr:glycosyltransferase family 2 protein [Nostoc sp. CENA543]AUT02012.1 glycosyl transferase [Nostoc sp. CENA543]
MNINQVINLFTYAVLLIGAFGFFTLSLILFLECFAALLPSDIPKHVNDGQPKKVAVLIPAHNEEQVISSTLLEIKSQLTNQHQLVVVADNCSDKTAAIAREIGAKVIEREDPICRGKGYALDYGLRLIESEPPDIVVFCDADCKVEPGAIDKLVQYAIATNRPVQATYLMEKSCDASPKESVSVFAFKLKNLVRLRGLAKLGIPCLLTGTGMAFPWSVIKSVDLASGYIVEDMKLGLDLAIAGYAPVFCSEANVTALLPKKTQAVKSQRTRWEHGHLKTLLTYVPKLIGESIKQARLDLLLSGLDLCVPPLSLLMLIWLMLVTVTFGLGLLTNIWMPVAILALASLLLLSGILIAWMKFGRTDLPLLQLLAIPLYILGKIPLYLKFLVKPQNSWIRTERDSTNISQS